jgi:large subunit ribosomal protein L18
MARDRNKAVARQRRRWRIRKRVRGTAERPRVCIYKGNANLHVQAIDDETGTVVATASTVMREFRTRGLASPTNIEAARAVAELLAKRLAEKHVGRVVFDRSGYVYHGRVKAVAEALRAAKIAV